MSSGVHEKYHDAGNSGSAITLDLNNGSTQKLTLTAACTLAFSNTPTSGKAYGFTLLIAQDATGSRVVTWPSSVKWSNGTMFTLSTLANKVDAISMFTVDGGITWYAGAVGKSFG